MGHRFSQMNTDYFNTNLYILKIRVFLKHLSKGYARHLSARIRSFRTLLNAENTDKYLESALSQMFFICMISLDKNFDVFAYDTMGVRFRTVVIRINLNIGCRRSPVV